MKPTDYSTDEEVIEAAGIAGKIAAGEAAEDIRKMMIDNLKTNLKEESDCNSLTKIIDFSTSEEYLGDSFFVYRYTDDKYIIGLEFANGEVSIDVCRDDLKELAELILERLE